MRPSAVAIAFMLPPRDSKHPAPPRPPRYSARLLASQAVAGPPPALSRRAASSSPSLGRAVFSGVGRRLPSCSRLAPCWIEPVARRMKSACSCGQGVIASSSRASRSRLPSVRIVGSSTATRRAGHGPSHTRSSARSRTSPTSWTRQSLISSCRADERAATSPPSAPDCRWGHRRRLATFYEKRPERASSPTSVRAGIFSDGFVKTPRTEIIKRTVDMPPVARRLLVPFRHGGGRPHHQARVGRAVLGRQPQRA